MTISIQNQRKTKRKAAKKNNNKQTIKTIFLFLWKETLKVREVFNFTETPEATRDMDKQCTTI